MATRRLCSFTPLTLIALTLLCPAVALAADIPGINGHMTDPLHLLSSGDKNTIEEKLNKIQQDTRVDTAGWICDAPQDQLDALGLEAYNRWSIGAAWDNGVFFIIPKAGRVHVILDPNKPAELTPAEVTRVVNSDKPNATMMDRVDAISETAGTIIRNKSLKPRPQGDIDPKRGLVFAGFAGLVLIAAIIMTILGRKERASIPV